MNRYLFSAAALFGALMPLVFDSAFKGAVLLATAALVALALWRASAAARHLVWLVAIVALLIVPVLSLALPQWRVLPQWAGGAVAVRAGDRPYTPYKAYRADEEPTAIAEDPAPMISLPPPTAPMLAARSAQPASRIQHARPTWREWLPLAWCAGFALLAVRLFAAHLLLRRAARSCPALTAPPDEKIAAAFTVACTRLCVRQSVTLLLDKKRTIPVVWGVFRPRLMLPLEARNWSDEQLCSVLLHELGHIKRRDTLVQWLTQIACALHWWNPLVWLAAWRLHAERERACDDLVLASGVRPSAYAEHLLDVATRLSPARWTSACGLAMARKSSLEGRLMAVLSEKLNRNGVTRALAIAALVLGAAIALPVAMLRAADEQWNPPQAANIGTNDFTTYCVHDGKSAAYIIAYHGIFGSSSEHTSNSKTRTWRDAATLTLETPAGKKNIEFHREHTAPNKLTLAETEYDLANGHLFLINAEGTVRQLDQKIEVVENSEGAAKLKKQIDEIPPQVRESVEAPMAGALTIATTDINAVVSPVAGKAIAFEIGSGEDKRIVVHADRSDAEELIIRCDADDRAGRWWNQIKLINDGHPESSFPILPDGWLPKGKFTFLDKADASLTFAEVVSGDVRTPVRIRLATPGEMSGGNSGAPHPKTSPSAAVYLDERIYSLKGDALDRAKTVPLPAALDIIGGGRMISRPMVVSTKRNGPHYHPTEATLDVVTKIVPGGVKVVGSVSFRFPEAKYASAFDASRARSEQGPFKEISAPVDAMLGLNDALVVPLASPEHFPEPLVAYITAIARPVARASWTPPANRPPLEADGWVLKWPRSDDKWFRSLFDYEGFPELLESALERRSAPPANGVWTETISSLDNAEVEGAKSGGYRRVELVSRARSVRRQWCSRNERDGLRTGRGQ